MEKNQYFYRTVVFTRKAGQVALADINKPEDTTPLEEWLGVVISLADGKHTLHELTAFIRGHYQTIPESLDDTLTSVVERLTEGNMIKLSKSAVELPYYLAAPIEQLDVERAKKLMQADGYNLH